ncbi:MAG: hypothetical protein IPK04_19395 [Bdellovibrionales bacterium]|jgi:hypothetical protein|nr:hypothetical protein [Bdellovibrionales bacterium]
MSFELLDKYFPWLVFFYGFILLVVLENPTLTAAVISRRPEALEWLAPRRKFAWSCFFIGGLWSLQNLWI